MGQTRLFEHEYENKRKCPYCGHFLKLRKVRIIGRKVIWDYYPCNNPDCSLNNSGVKYTGFTFEAPDWRKLLK